MEKKEKPLERMTAKELREMALGLPGIQGVHAMKKEELIAAIRKAKGLPEEPESEKPAAARILLNKAELKAKLKEMKIKKAEAFAQKDRKLVRILRRRISRLKKRIRRATV